ncbi:MAG: PD40 domain-containing protein [Planctomycetes bacterium]|nr:PD40 domain-containing protein [Planctomycetota bacterium]
MAFESDGTNLIAFDSNGGFRDIFVRDLVAGTTEVVSVNSSGVQSYWNCYAPSISADGTRVVFHSAADNLVLGDTNVLDDVFLHDRVTGMTELVSQSSSGVFGADRSFNARIAPNGDVVAFESNSTNLVPGDTNGFGDVFARVSSAGTTEIVSVTSSGAQANSVSFQPTLSADGRYIAFTSFATNLVVPDVNGGLGDVFVRDRSLGTTELISKSTANIQGAKVSAVGSISADGRFVAFQSEATNLVLGDTNSRMDIFVRDRDAGTTRRVSVSTTGIQANDGSYGPFVTADGRFVAFSSYATNLIAGDTNTAADVFVHNVSTGSLDLASIGNSGALPNQSSFAGGISSDGRRVVFESSATNLVVPDTNGSWVDVLLRDRGAPPTPQNYCLGKANSLGCMPLLTFTGAPSASAGSGFGIQASNVLNQRLGVILYSEVGSWLAPFAGGTLCVAIPLERGPWTFSAGNPPPNDCSGNLTFDFNVFIAGGADPSLVAGQQVWLQVWTRDPGFAGPDNIGLTEALTFVIGS